MSRTRVTPQEEQVLQDFLLSPAASTERRRGQAMAGDGGVAALTDAQVREVLEAHVPGVASMMDRTGQVPVADYISMTYAKGLPLYRNNVAVQQHTIRALRFVFHCAIAGKPSGGTDALRRLAEAYQSCQAEQGRTIDVLFGQLSGRDASLADQVLALVDGFKALTLEAVVHALNPGARLATDAHPSHQSPHITSAYLEAVGPELGLRGVAAASSDYNRPRGVKRREVLAAFRERFSLQELAGALAADVNQAGAGRERLIDRELLTKWAAESAATGAGAFDAHSIYFDEERSEEYEGRPAPGDEYQPFLSREVAKQVLVRLFDSAAEAPAAAFGEEGVDDAAALRGRICVFVHETVLSLDPKRALLAWIGELGGWLGLAPPSQKAPRRRFGLQ